MNKNNYFLLLYFYFFYDKNNSNNLTLIEIHFFNKIFKYINLFILNI